MSKITFVITVTVNSSLPVEQTKEILQNKLNSKNEVMSVIDLSVVDIWTPKKLKEDDDSLPLSRATNNHIHDPLPDR